VQVWEADARGQITFVEPFLPYKRAKDTYDELIKNGKDGIMLPWLTIAPLAVSPQSCRCHTVMCILLTQTGVRAAKYAKPF